MADLARHDRISRTIGAAMIASLLIYAVVVEFIRARFAPFAGFANARLLAARSAGAAPGAALQTASVAR